MSALAARHGVASSVAPCRDRTSELRAVADRLKGKLAREGAQADSAASEQAARREAARAARQQHAEFAGKAALIGRNIHATSTKLAKLAKLAKRTSMFADPVTEIQELTAVVKADIKALNVAIEELQATKGAQNKNQAQHDSTVVGSLKTRLAGATQDFKVVLQQRTDSLRVHQGRQQMFSNASPLKPMLGAPIRAASAGRGASAGEAAGAGAGLGEGGGVAAGAAMTRQIGAPAAAPTASQLFGAGGGGAQEAAPLLGGAQQSQALVARDQTSQYLQSRHEAVQQVESTIHELGGIFQQLATVVAEQGEVAIRIDDNIDDTLTNVDNAQGQLLKYLDRVQSNRWLILKIFGILMLFTALFVVFVA